jgi:hypothetical protein
MYSKWVNRGIHKPGKSAVGLAEALTKALKLSKPMHRGTIYKIIAGTREIHLNELAPIAAYIEEPIPLLPMGELLTIPIERELSIGTWYEVGTVNNIHLGSVIIPKDQEFPESEHRAFILKDDSMIDVGILNGDVIVCISAESQKPVDGTLIIIERKRAGLVEMSARRVLTFNDRVEYAACRENGDIYKPVIVTKKKRSSSENETVRIVAIIRRRTGIVK